MTEQKKSIWFPQVFWKLAKDSFRRLHQNDPFRMAGATAFFTCFALPPIIILVFQAFSIFFSKKLVGTQLGQVLSETLGEEGAKQLRDTARSFSNLAQNWYMAAIGLVFLFFVATTLFKVVKNTLNDIWNLRLEKAGFVYDLKGRGRSLVIIFAAALLFIAGAVIDIVSVVASKYIGRVWQNGVGYFTSALNEIVGVVIVTVWFIVLFRYLASGRPSWKVSIAGGILTGILFSIGKTILSEIMKNTNTGAVYGAGGAIVLILLFVFYSSFILYFGASFIKEYSLYTGDEIVPSSRAYLYELHKIEEEEKL